jgi:FlaA1/EpsC-like NDP-sugar epimerase
MKLIDKIENYNEHNKCNIFGAGKYGRLLVEYISKLKSDEAIRNILVSDKRNNPDKIGKIRVVEINNTGDIIQGGGYNSRRYNNCGVGRKAK